TKRRRLRQAAHRTDIAAFASRNLDGRRLTRAMIERVKQLCVRWRKPRRSGSARPTHDEPLSDPGPCCTQGPSSETPDFSLDPCVPDRIPRDSRRRVAPRPLKCPAESPKCQRLETCDTIRGISEVHIKELVAARSHHHIAKPSIDPPAQQRVVHRLPR